MLRLIIWPGTVVIPWLDFERDLYLYCRLQRTPLDCQNFSWKVRMVSTEPVSEDAFSGKSQRRRWRSRRRRWPPTKPEVLSSTFATSHFRIFTLEWSWMARWTRRIVAVALPATRLQAPNCPKSDREDSPDQDRSPTWSGSCVGNARNSSRGFTAPKPTHSQRNSHWQAQGVLAPSTCNWIRLTPDR